MFSRKIYLICVILLLLGQVVLAQEANLQIELGVKALAVEWSPDGALIAVGTERGVKLYDVNLEEVATLQDYNQQVVALSWSPDAQQLAGVGYPYEAGIEIYIPIFTSSLLIWERDTSNKFSLVQKFDYPDQKNVIDVAWSPNGAYLAVHTSEFLPRSDLAFGSIEIWDTATWEIKSNLQLSLREMFADMAWSPDSTLLASGGEAWCYELIPCTNDAEEIYGHGIFIMDVLTGEIQAFQELGWWVHGIAWSTDNTIAVVAFELEIYDDELSQLLLRSDTQYGEYRVLLLPNQTELLVWSFGSDNDNNSIGFIDIINTASLESRFHLEILEIQALSLSPDGLNLAIIDTAQTLFLYNIPSLNE